MELNFQSGTFKGLFVTMVASFVIGCEKTALEDATNASTSGLTAAQIAGTHTATCHANSGGNFGTDLNGTSYLRTIIFNANNTYAHYLHFFDTANCTGNNIFSYFQAGIFSPGSALPSGETAVAYGTGNSFLTVYDASWVTSLNGVCNTSFTINVTTNVNDDLCNGGNIALPAFPAASETQYGLVALDNAASPTTISVNTPNPAWSLGVTNSYPTTTGLTIPF